MSDPTDQAPPPASPPVPGATVLPPPSPGWTPAPAPASGPPPAPYPPAAYAPSWTPPQRNFRRGFGPGRSRLGAGSPSSSSAWWDRCSDAHLRRPGGRARGRRPDQGRALKTIWGPRRPASCARSACLVRSCRFRRWAHVGSGAYGYDRPGDRRPVKSDADGLVLLLNTPGGSINGSKAIADAMARYKTAPGTRVRVRPGMSASGGMYAMAGADKILADHGSLVGSIGVIAGPFERYKDVTAITGTMLTAGVVTSGGSPRSTSPRAPARTSAAHGVT